jgi:hypothetical protein
MQTADLRTHLGNLLHEVDKATGYAKTAEKNRKPLGGHNPYADKFHAAVVAITTTEKKVRPHLDGLGLTPEELQQFDDDLATIKDTTTKAKDRVVISRQVRLLCETVILHKSPAMTASPVPATESVLPRDMFPKEKPFLRKLIDQINGCYERQWYDACSVIIRKLAEVLIIDVYEKRKDEHEIKDHDGNFRMLSKLIDHIKNKPGMNLGREAGPCLDEIKKAGDRSAHHRHYIATKRDVDKLTELGLRAAIHDLYGRTV